MHVSKFKTLVVDYWGGDQVDPGLAIPNVDYSFPNLRFRVYLNILSILFIYLLKGGQINLRTFVP